MQLPSEWVADGWDYMRMRNFRSLSLRFRGGWQRDNNQIKHALLIVQQLEGSLDYEQGGTAARHLADFYSYARAKMMEAQIKGDGRLLERLIGHFAEVRGAWREVDPGISKAASQPVGEPSILSCTV